MSDERWLTEHFGCRLSDPDLLAQALSHRSLGARNNERLEFLGDAVLTYVMSDVLFERFPQADEGQLSRLRVSLVKGTTLAAVAREIDLGDHLRLGTGEQGGRQRASILADTFEAILGAISLDQGFPAARSAILQVFSRRLEALDLSQAQKDPKTRLQELLQGQGRALPDYQLVEAHGEEHRRTFVVTCELKDQGLKTEGEGSSRRAAEQRAATGILAFLEAP